MSFDTRIIIGKCSYDIKKPSGQDRTAADRNDVAKATRRRRRIPQAGFFLVQNISGKGARKCFDMRTQILLPGTVKN